MCVMQSSPEILSLAIVLLVASISLSKGGVAINVSCYPALFQTRPAVTGTGFCAGGFRYEFARAVSGPSFHHFAFHCTISSSCTLLSSSVLMVWDLWLGIIFIGTNNFWYSCGCFVVLHSARLWQVRWSPVVPYSGAVISVEIHWLCGDAHTGEADWKWKCCENAGEHQALNPCLKNQPLCSVVMFCEEQSVNPAWLSWQRGGTRRKQQSVLCLLLYREGEFLPSRYRCD